MVKLYYDKKTGYLCNRYPLDIKQSKTSPYIEVSDEVADDTYCCDGGKSWAVINNELKMVEVPELMTPELEQALKQNRIRELKDFLLATDYVIIKLYEAYMSDTTQYNELKKEYADIIAQRKAAREEIGLLERNLKKEKK